MSKFDTYIPGGDCSCEARYESECACDADWTPREVYKLREELAAERALADRMAYYMITLRKRHYRNADPACVCNDCETARDMDAIIEAWRELRK
jgi:hypothetical protein